MCINKTFTYVMYSTAQPNDHPAATIIINGRQRWWHCSGRRIARANKDDAIFCLRHRSDNIIYALPLHVRAIITALQYYRTGRRCSACSRLRSHIRIIWLISENVNDRVVQVRSRRVWKPIVRLWKCCRFDRRDTFDVYSDTTYKA